MRRTISNAAPAATRSTMAWERSEATSSGSSSTGSRVVRPPRSARPTSPGSTTVPLPRGTSSWRASSSSGGVRASSGSTVCRAAPVVASPPLSATCSSSVRARSDSSPSCRSISAAGRGSGERGCSPLSPAAAPPPSPSAAPLRARRPCGDSHARVRSSSRCSAASTSAGSACTSVRSSSGVVWTATTRASRTASSRRVSRSRVRSSEARVAARAASWPKSCGAGVARSGRSRSRCANRSSGQARSWSARVRYPSVRVLDPDIPATLPARAARGTTYAPAHPGGGMSQVELQHGAATDVGRVREVNEDAFLVAPPVFVVADGMGGHDGGDVASAIVVEEFARLAQVGLRPAPRRRRRRRHARGLPGPDPGVHRGAPRRRRRDLPRRHHRGGRPAGRGRRRPALAADEPRRLPRLPVRRRRPRAGQRGPQPGAGDGRRGHDHPGAGRGAPGAARGHPGPRRPARRRRPLPGAAGGGAAAAALLRRRHRDDRRRADRGGAGPGGEPAGGGRGAGRRRRRGRRAATTPRPSSSTCRRAVPRRADPTPTGTRHE